MAGLFFRFPQSLATLTESSILNTPFGLSSQRMQVPCCWGWDSSSFRNCQRWMWAPLVRLLGPAWSRGVLWSEGLPTGPTATATSISSSSSSEKSPAELEPLDMTGGDHWVPKSAGGSQLAAFQISKCACNALPHWKHKIIAVINKVCLARKVPRRPWLERSAGESGWGPRPA